MLVNEQVSNENNGNDEEVENSTCGKLTFQSRMMSLARRSKDGSRNQLEGESDADNRSLPRLFESSLKQSTHVGDVQQRRQRDGEVERRDTSRNNLERHVNEEQTSLEDVRENRQQPEKSSAFSRVANVVADSQLEQKEHQMSRDRSPSQKTTDSEPEHADAESLCLTQRSHSRDSTISQIDRLIRSARREGELLATL